MLDILVFVGYLAVVLLIGRLASRRVETAEDFHLCGRKLGRLPAAFSLAATEFNGSGLIGGAGLAYAIGISGIYWNYAAVPVWILIGITVAPKLRRMALDTVPGYLGQRFGIETQRLVALLQVVEAVVFTAVQITVSALTLDALFGLDMFVGATLVTSVFAAYTMMGGLWAVVWTDVLQYVILMIGILVAAPMAVYFVGGIAEFQAALPAEHLDPTRLGLAEPLAWVALCLYSYSTDQAYMQRSLAARDPAVARFAFIYTGCNYIVFGACVAILGMAASILLPGLENQDAALPTLIHEVLPAGFRAFFLTAILAATMSTSSSFLAAASSMVIQDLYEPMRQGGKRSSQASVVRHSRIATLLLAIGALVVSQIFPGVVSLVVFATIVAPAAVFVPFMFGLYWRRTNRAGAFWAMLITAVVGVLSQVFWYGQVDGWLGAIHPLFLGPAVGLAVLVVASLVKPGHDPIDHTNETA